MRSWVFHKFLKENPLYKLAALGISVLLWLILLNRRDFEVAATFDVEFRLPSSFIVSEYYPTQVKVHLFGPRIALKKVLDGSWSHVIVVDLVDSSSLKPGSHKVSLDKNTIDLPFGTKALAVTPPVVEFKIQHRP
jgi:hypothetical protein